MIYLAMVDLLKPAPPMEKASNMTSTIRFSTAIELFVGLSSECGKGLLRTATKRSIFSQITLRHFFGGLFQMER